MNPCKSFTDPLQRTYQEPIVEVEDIPHETAQQGIQQYLGAPRPAVNTNILQQDYLWTKASEEQGTPWVGVSHANMVVV